MEAGRMLLTDATPTAHRPRIDGAPTAHRRNAVCVTTAQRERDGLSEKTCRWRTVACGGQQEVLAQRAAISGMMLHLPSGLVSVNFSTQKQPPRRCSARVRPGRGKTAALGLSLCGAA